MRTTVTNEAEKKQTEQDAIISKLKKKVEGLQSELTASRNSQLDRKMFKKEASSVNEKGLMIRRSFYDLMTFVQEMHQNLLHSERVINQQREEFLSTTEIRRRVNDYQKQQKVNKGIKQFSFMELKRF